MVTTHLRATLQLILDHVDYVAGNCAVNEPVGAALPESVITQAREAIAREQQAERDDDAEYGDMFSLMFGVHDRIRFMLDRDDGSSIEAPDPDNGDFF